MRASPLPYNESERIEALYRLNIIDTPAEQDFDDLTVMASSLCDTPYSLITFVDKERQWFKAKTGINITETHRDISFCAHALHSSETFIVADTLKDERFIDNPFVANEPNIRFYAGTPIVTDDGFILGTLCVLDSKPRTLSDKQIFYLRTLANQVQKLLQLRKIVNTSAYKLNVYQNGTSDAVFLLDKHLHIQDFNKVTNEFIWHNPDKIIKTGDSILNYLEKEYIPVFETNVKKALAGEEMRFECRIRHENNYLWWAITFLPVYNQFKEITGVVHTATKINERKKAEIVLQENEQLLQNIFKSSPVALLISRYSDGLVVMVNEALAKIALSTPNQLIGKLTKDFYTNPEQREDIIETLNTKGFIKNREIELTRSNGLSSPCLLSSEIITWKGEKMIMSGFVDISEIKFTEMELNKSLNMVTEQNKRLLNFSYIVSHNLRSHASNIKSIVSYLQEPGREEEKKEMIKHLSSVSHALDDTLHNLNEVVSIHNNTNLIFENLDIHTYVNKAIELISPQIEQKDAVIHNLIPENTTINYNPAYLESIIYNFLSNAVKYASPGRQPHITLNTYFHNNKFVLEIADNGIGIDLARNGDKLFGMYKTFHGNADAKGIGLFITKNQVEFMGGKIEVDSTLNKGTTFKIYF